MATREIPLNAAEAEGFAALESQVRAVEQSRASLHRRFDAAMRAVLERGAPVDVIRAEYRPGDSPAVIATLADAPVPAALAAPAAPEGAPSA